MKIQINRVSCYSVIAALALAMAAPVTVAKEESKVKSSFDNTGVDEDASASIQSSFKTSNSKLMVRAKGLNDGSTYRLMVEGVEKAEFTSRRGKAKLTFSSAPVTNALPLDFDPRARLVSIADESDSVLETQFDSEGDSDDSRIKEETELAPTALAPGGEGEASYKRNRGREAFEVEIEDVPQCDYELYVDSILRGTITIGRRDKGSIEFDSQPSPSKLPLDFDPRSKNIEVLCNGEAYFSGTMIADINGVNNCTVEETAKALASTGEDPDASADAKFKTEDDCEREFEVEVEDVDAGDYELLVDGVFRGTITVVAVTGGTRGELEFSSDVDEAGKLPLDFDPQGAPIVIQQGATVFFDDNFSGGIPVTPLCEEITTDVGLINSGVDASAKGKARFRQDSDCEQDFRVEIEDLPAGDYTLNVGGVDKGALTVETLLNGEREGELEFDTDPDEPGEVLLDFDPRGMIIDVVQDGAVFLSRSFPN